MSADRRVSRSGVVRPGRKTGKRSPIGSSMSMSGRQGRGLRTDEWRDATLPAQRRERSRGLA